MLRLGWKLYTDVLELGDEVWVYFHGAKSFEPGVYIRGRVTSVDLADAVVLLRVLELSVDQPLTDAAATSIVAEAVAPRFRQVFVFPETLRSTDSCTAPSSGDTCKRRLCEGCPFWNALERIPPAAVSPPERLTVEVQGYAPAYWVIPSRAHEPWRIRAAVQRTSELFYRFKVGQGSLAFPLALGIRQSLLDRELRDFDAIVPVPLSPDKKGRKELDRTEALSQELHILVGAPVRPVVSLDRAISKRALDTTKYDFEMQYDAALNLSDEAETIQRALVVDDVCTWGSTLNTVASALRRANPAMEIVLATAGQMVVKNAVADKKAVWDSGPES